MSKQKEIKYYIEQAKKGNQSAFSHLLDFYWDEVYFYMYKYTKNESITDDIVIQTFAKAFEKINTYNDTYALNTWLISIAKNLYIDSLRKKNIDTIDLQSDDAHHQKLSNIVDRSPNIEEQIIYEQNLAKLHEWIKKLPSNYKEIIQLRFFQEKSYKEIAELRDEPLNTIKVKILRAKKLLIEMLEKSKR